jgi:uncharacterized protein (DUF2252 family)
MSTDVVETPAGAARSGPERGRAARKEAPRRSHSEWRLRTASDRDPVAILQAQAETRVPELVPIRYGRMLESPFAFYRGAAAVMAADLARTATTGLRTQLAGDAHLANFGGFAAPDRAIVFDLNDFDETLPGPFEWDLKRLAASFAVAGRTRGVSAARRGGIARTVGRSYREAMRGFAEMARLEVWYARLDSDEIVRRWGTVAGKTQQATMKRTLAKARQRDSSRAFSRYSTVGLDGRLRPISQPPLVVPLDELLSGDELAAASAVVESAMRAYIDSLPDDRRRLVEGYQIVGLARKVVGVGSVGTRCWIVLMVAIDDELDDLVLQVKEAAASVLEDHVQSSEYENSGRRVVEGQRLMQGASDGLLGWTRLTNVAGETHDFYVRQMWDGKVSADLGRMTPSGYLAYAEMCGWTLARAHARSGDRKAIAAYLGNGEAFDAALADFAESYADQNDADYRLLRDAADSGAIPVEHA